MKNGNEIELAGTIGRCEVSAVGKSAQQAHPKTVTNNITTPVEMVETDLMGAITRAAIGGYTYVSKIIAINSRWKEVYLTTTMEEAVDSMVDYVKKTGIPVRFRVIVRTEIEVGNTRQAS